MKDAKGHGSNPRGTHASGVEKIGAKTTSTKQVIKAIGNDKLQLLRGNGYWYFVYDDPAKGLFDTMSVYTMHLGNYTVEQWAAEGRELVARVQNEYASRTRK